MTNPTAGSGWVSCRTRRGRPSGTPNARSSESFHREGAAERIPPQTDHEVGVLVVFMVPGHLIATEFEGMRARSYHKTERTKRCRSPSRRPLVAGGAARLPRLGVFGSAARRADGAATA
jgi:hypothetical protein